MKDWITLLISFHAINSIVTENHITYTSKFSMKSNYNNNRMRYHIGLRWQWQEYVTVHCIKGRVHTCQEFTEYVNLLRKDILKLILLSNIEQKV